MVELLTQLMEDCSHVELQRLNLGAYVRVEVRADDFIVASDAPTLSEALQRALEAINDPERRAEVRT